ncbi:MAG TPA: TatD family hydrolase [Burkholderiales bacterium]|nr:TatD family hydrolase [Burkholderiales bacterium]
MFVDTHCHLDAAEFDHDRSEVISRSREAGVGAFVVPAVEREAFEKVLSICGENLCCYPALGIHPMYVDEAVPEDIEVLRSKALEVTAIGEIGLDFFVEHYDREKQIGYFESQLKVAREFDLPVLLHVRRSQDTVLASLRKIGVKGGIAHAFNGSFQQAEEFIKLGFKLGFGGAMTYDRALKIRSLAQNLPLEAIVLETDSPDMPPSFIGRTRNSPEYLPKIAEVLAELRKMPAAEIAIVTTENAMDVLELE